MVLRVAVPPEEMKPLARLRRIGRSEMNLDTGVERTTGPLQAFLRRNFSFLKRQQRDWKITVIRTSLDRLAYQVVFPYLSVYIMALGATGLQLGIVNSIGMIVAGICGPYTGWLIDRIGPKKIYLSGIAILVASYLCYGLARSWETTIIAMVGYWLGYSTSIHSCATICGNCLSNRDRATGMLICETVAAGLLGVVGPMTAAWLVGVFGGVDADGIRPLFFSALLVTAGTFVIVWTQLSETGPVKGTTRKTNLLADISHVLAGGRDLKKWLVISSISQLPLGMVFPYTQAFAHSVKGADEFVLGAMVTGSALTSIVFAIPFGRLADRIGRKKLLGLTIPLFWLSNIVLVLAPSPALLFIAGILQGFYFIGSPITSAIERELVRPEHMGRWLGINRCFKMLVSAGMAFAAGLIWDRIGPEWIFIIFVAIDLLIRIPLLYGMPETLHASLETDAAACGQAKQPISS
jgi:MFS family permease